MDWNPEYPYVRVADITVQVEDDCEYNTCEFRWHADRKGFTFVRYIGGSQTVDIAYEVDDILTFVRKFDAAYNGWVSKGDPPEAAFLAAAYFTLYQYRVTEVKA